MEDKKTELAWAIAKKAKGQFDQTTEVREKLDNKVNDYKDKKENAIQAQKTMREEKKEIEKELETLGNEADEKVK